MANEEQLLSRKLELALIKAIKEAKVKKHEYVTVEHMLWGLLHDETATDIIEKYGGSNKSLKERLEEFLADGGKIPLFQTGKTKDPSPSVAFNRVLQRALNDVQSAGKQEVDTGDLLLSIFAEPDSDAVYFLVSEGVCKLEVIAYLSSLKGKNLKRARFVNFDMRYKDLRDSDLRQANLSGADITGVKLYNSARENWIIDGIRCEYVYWDEAGEQRTPPDRDFRPGEFEELYKQLPTFEYIFEQGFTPLDPLIMDRVVQAVNKRHKEFSLELINFDKRGQPHATFTVCHLEHVEKAKQQIAAGYEESRIAPEQQAQLMAAVVGLIENQSKSLEIIKQLGEAMGDTYNIHGGQIGAVGQSASASGNTFQQITADLSRLHEEMQRSAKTTEQRAAAEDVAKAAQSARENDESAMLQHLKNAGRFALDCAKTIGTDVTAECLKKAMGM